MKSRLLSAISMILGVFGFSQTTEIYFKYDEAGNQRYRGTNINARQTEPDKAKTVTSSQKEEEKDKKFWEGVKMHPVPVEDILTLEWTDENNELIDHVSLYEHTRLNFVFQQKNLPNINKQVQIDMSKMYMGVYILSFQLKNGKVVSRNIYKK